MNIVDAIRLLEGKRGGSFRLKGDVPTNDILYTVNQENPFTLHKMEVRDGGGHYNWTPTVLDLTSEDWELVS